MLFLPRLALGGDEEIRTLDPLLAGQVLSQLSYTPRCLPGFGTLKIEQRNPFPLRLNSFVFVFCASCEMGTFVSISSDRLSFELAVLSP